MSSDYHRSRKDDRMANTNRYECRNQKAYIEVGDDTMANRYQCGNQKAYIEVGQTIQWPTDTNVVIRRHTLK
jgi:hypothetical protein